jgi:hypothetical protein
MSMEGDEDRPARSASPSKHPMDSNERERPFKRRKLVPVELSSGSRELAPRPPHLQIKTATPPPPPPKRAASSNNKRTTTLNLKNYPGNHHPVGIAVWILQKVEQARREQEAQRNASHNGNALSQPSAVSSPVESAGSNQWQNSSLSSYVNVQPAQEQEAERLQAQRNRKTKQRQENWAKSNYPPHGNYKVD